MQDQKQYLADMEKRRRALEDDVTNLQLLIKKLTSDVNHLKDDMIQEQANHDMLRVRLAEETQTLLKDRTLDIVGIEQRLNDRRNKISVRERMIDAKDKSLDDKERELFELENKINQQRKISDKYFASGTASREVYSELLDGIKFNVEGSDKAKQEADINLEKSKEIRTTLEAEYDEFITNRELELEKMETKRRQLQEKEDELSKKEMVVDKKIEIAVEEKVRAKAELANLMRSKKYLNNK